MGTKKTKEEKTASLEASMIKEITNREEEKNIKGETLVDKVNIESTKEKISIDETKTKESKNQTAEVLKASCKQCVHDISISDFCKGCADNQKSLDRRSSKKPKENDNLENKNSSKKVTDTKLLKKKEIKIIKKEKAEVKGGKMEIIESKKDVSMTEQDEKKKKIIEEKKNHNNSDKKTDNLNGVLKSKETDVEAKSLPKKT